MTPNALRALAPCSFALAVAGCDNAATPSLEPQADLKVVHVSAGLGVADLDIGGIRVINGMAFGTSSVTRVPAGVHRLTLRAGGSVVTTLDLELTSEHVNSITLANGAMQVSAIVTPDTGQAASNRANIRMINVASGENADPTLLHALINFPGVAPDSAAKIGLDTKIASHGTLMYFDPGHFRFRFVPQGTTTVLADVEFDVAAGQKKAVVLQRENGVYRAEVVTEP